MITRAKDAWEDQKDKRCEKCGEIKPYDAFERNQIGVNNRIVRRPVCKECRSYKKPISKKDRDAYTEKHPRPKLGEAFTCPICRHTTYPKHTNQICLDHDHKTGKIRGYICGNCNASLGKFEESIPILRRAISWLMGTLKFFPNTKK